MSCIYDHYSTKQNPKGYLSKIKIKSKYDTNLTSSIIHYYFYKNQIFSQKIKYFEEYVLLKILFKILNIQSYAYLQK